MLVVIAAMPSAGAVRLTGGMAWAESSASCTSQPTILLVYAGMSSIGKQANCWSCQNASHTSQYAHMKSPKTVEALEEFGRIRLSPSFFMRDFLYSEIANCYGLSNIPDNPDLAIEVGKHLCQELLEPLNATFGRLQIRSAFRSAAVNQVGNDKGHNCASNHKNFAGHIWDHLDADGKKGATAWVVVSWFADQCERGMDWRAMAYWIHDHLPYSELEFYPTLAAFNINWHEKPKRIIRSYIKPTGLLSTVPDNGTGWTVLYDSFPSFR